MHPLKTIALGVLAWPAAEIVAFFCVAAVLGFAKALILIVLTSMAGLLVLRHFSGARTVQTAEGSFIAASAWSERGLAPGLGGFLLLIPGFLTSILAVLVMFPMSRRLLLAGMGRLFATGSRKPADPGVIDLAPDEWQPLPGTTLPPGDDSAGRRDTPPRNQF